MNPGPRQEVPEVEVGVGTQIFPPSICLPIPYPCGTMEAARKRKGRRLKGEKEGGGEKARKVEKEGKERTWVGER